ncbi:MAG: hypothetical protein ACE5JK_00695 [Candidatus Omnitrophota bacterium]
MKVLHMCLGAMIGLMLLGGAAFVWNACGNLSELGLGLIVTTLVVLGCPS